MLWRAKCINEKTGAERTVEVVAENYSKAYFEAAYVCTEGEVITELFMIGA